SLPMTLKHTWLTTSGITGLTLAGMIDDPAWSSGRLISPSPARGPDESRRRSLQILDSFAARRLSAECTARYAPLSYVASTRFSAGTVGRPLTSARRRVATLG